MMSEVKQKYITWAEKNGSYCGELEDGSLVGSDARLEFAGFEAGYQEQQAKIDEALQILNEAYKKGIIEKPKAIPEAMKALRGEHE